MGGCANPKTYLLLAAFSLTMTSTALAGIVYVDADASGANDGSSWADAYNYLQDALAAAWSGDEIRVAQGIYTPDSNSADPNGSGDRQATFQLINGVTLKGGYAGAGTQDPNAHDIELYETILSGDLNGDDVEFVDPCDLPTEPTRAENSYRVASAVETDETAVFDGFTITAGNANGKDWPVYQNRGGGMYTDSASPTLTNCTFSKNSATGYGGGICNLFGNPTVTSCTFNANTATKAGGGMCNINSGPKVNNCTFSSNSASYGGGMYSNTESSTIVNNCTFTENSAEYGGGIYGGGCLISSCTITSNNAFRGGGLSFSGYYDTFISISNSTISGNKAEGYGGGMYNSCATPTVSNCIISNNTAGNWGGGICNFGDTDPSKSTLISCTVSGNSAKYGGGIYNIENGHATLRSCLVTGNRAELGAAIYNGWWTSATLTNCTLSGNWAEGRGGAMYNEDAEWWDEVTLTNCVLWADTPEEIYLDERTLLVTYSDVQGGWPGEGNIDADPCFVQPGYWDANGTWVDGDYHLMIDSPCINAGEPNYVTGPNEMDLDGNPRVMGGRLDFGAYESYKQASLFVVSADLVVVTEGRTSTFTVALATDPMCVVNVTVSRYSGDPDITIESGQVLTFDSSNYSKPQTVTLAAAEDDHDNINGMAPIWVHAPGFALTVVTAVECDNEPLLIVLYVDADAPGASNGMNWRDAFTDLQDAIQLARSLPQVNYEIRVAQGVYTPAVTFDRRATFQLTNGLSMKGGFAGFGEPDPNSRNIHLYETILSGDLRGNDIEVVDPADLFEEWSRSENSYHVVTTSGTDETTVLDGFIITGGNANGHDYNHYGGGMYNYSSSTTLINCTFSANSAIVGGAMFNLRSRLTLIGCLFQGNWAYDGGGMSVSDSSPTLTNCTFTGNSARDGGGMNNYNHSSPTLANCTFSTNVSSSDGGGIYNYQCIPTLVNCVLIGNAASENAGAIYNQFSSPTITNCTFIVNSSGENAGGIYNYWDNNLKLTNCTFVGNSADRGKGLACDSREQMYPNNLKIINCILWDGGNEIWNNDGSTITVSYSDIQGGWPGESNIDADPCFVELGYWDVNSLWIDGDYHLLPDSPCIDAGDPNYVAEPNETDFDGKPRVIGGRIDMGAYEYSPSIQAEVRIVPRTVNLQSKGKWINAFLWLPEDYNVTDIDADSVLLEDEIEPQWVWFDEEEHVAMVRFSRQEVQDILTIGEVKLTITGRLTDGTIFEAKDVIIVINKGGRKSAL